jgi:aspartyl aminopeptidase
MEMMVVTVPDKDTLKELQERLTFSPRLVWDEVPAAARPDILAYAEQYKNFLDAAKTEREAVLEVQRLAQEQGYVDLAAGDPAAGKYFFNYRGKTLALINLGPRPVRQGLRLVAAHIDSPRLDLKQNPLYEDTDLVFLKTHYYGGIKKYQWLARPLALHGVVYRPDGQAVTLRLGEDPGEPVLTVCDLLPHLARKAQMDKKVDEAFVGEKLNLLAGSLPLGDKETKERFKLQLLHLLSERYGLTEEDLISAELEAVPAGPARDVGWDASMVGGYGQDDRAAAFAAVKAILEVSAPPWPCLTLLVDKEEIGSAGNTSAQSILLEELVARLLELQGEAATWRRQVLMQSQAISADVAAALDPDWPEVYEKRNAARLGYGVVLTKYTGHGGKYHANDAHAEYIHWIRQVFNQAGVIWQASELGKVDEGGGGTIAKFLAAYGLDVVDCGPALLSMHSPFEIAAKADLYMTYKAYHSFLAAAV